MIKQNQYNPLQVTHPGKTLSEKLNEIGMSSKEFALKIGDSENTINEIVNGTLGIRSELAKKFELATMIPEHFWLNLQSQYDETTNKER